MNEHDNLTPGDMESYRSALKEAYPQPKSDIHGAVMKQIRAERLAEKKRARRSAFVKWGSIAACLALVCLIGWRVIPGGDDFAPLAVNDAEDYYLTKNYGVAPCEADEADNAVGMYSADEWSSYTYGANGDVNAELQSELVVSTSGDDGEIGKSAADYQSTPNVPTAQHGTSAPEMKPQSVETEPELPETESAEETESEETEETEETEPDGDLVTK